MSDDCGDEIASIHLNEKPAKRAKHTKMYEKAKQIEMITFQDLSSGATTGVGGGGSSAIEQPCLKFQITLYDPLELINNNGKSSRYGRRSSLNNKLTDTGRLLNRTFDNINIQLNHCLNCELDISIIDRLYYLLNDVSKVSLGQTSTSTTTTNTSSSCASNNESTLKLRNLELKCVQQVKLAVRFPLADLRRVNQQTSTVTTLPKLSVNIPSTVTHSQLNPFASIKPQTMIAFRRVRDQILTLHLFDLNFQNLANATTNSADLLLTLTCSQINTYYQYGKDERPIHFGLIQQRAGESRSLICAIKIPNYAAQQRPPTTDCQLLVDDLTQHSTGSGELDSLRDKYNINLTSPNKFYRKKSHTIKEESELSTDDDDKTKTQTTTADEADPTDQTDDDDQEAGGGGDDDEDDEDEDDFEQTSTSYGPFSRIHSLISSEKNRRIVNAGNRNEMNEFTSESKKNSETIIRLQIPQIKCLLVDQKFLNDLYNCLLNDLIMWVPTRIPPIESTLHVYDAQTGLFIAPNLAHIIESNLELDFFLNNPNINMASIYSDLNSDEAGHGGGDDFAAAADDDDELCYYDDTSVNGKQFHMCKSAILKSPLDAQHVQDCADGADSVSGQCGAEDYCESDDDKYKRKYMDKFNKMKQKLNKPSRSSRKSTSPANTICVHINIEKAHLKAIVTSATTNRYGEFDLRTNNFQFCIATSESQKSVKNKIG